MDFSTILSVGIGLALLAVGWEWVRSFRSGKRAAARPPKVEPPTTASWPAVSVLVPAWSEAPVLERCLQALRQVDYPCWEAVLIAGGPDGTYEVAEGLNRDGKFVLIRQGGGGKNAALNRGLEAASLKAASGDVIATLDADSVVRPDWLCKLVRPLLNGADASYGKHIPLRQTWVSKTEQMENIAACLVDQQYILQGSGSIAVRREALEQIGCFPEAVKTGVDWDLSFRLVEAGRKIMNAEDALVWTYRPATLHEFWNNEVRWRRAHLRSLLNHRGWFFQDLAAILANGRLYALIVALGLAVIVDLLIFLSGNYQAGLAVLAGIGLVLITLAARRAALAGKVAGYTGDDRWLLFSWSPAVLLLVSFAATWAALLTFRRLTVHFKGPRGGI